MIEYNLLRYGSQLYNREIIHKGDGSDKEERGRYVQIDKGVYHYSVVHDAKIRFQVSCCSGHISSSRIPYLYIYISARVTLC